MHAVMFLYRQSGLLLNLPRGRLQKRLFGLLVLRVYQTCGRTEQKLTGRITKFVCQQQLRLFVRLLQHDDAGHSVRQHGLAQFFRLQRNQIFFAAARRIKVVFSRRILQVKHLQKLGFQQCLRGLFCNIRFFHTQYLPPEFLFLL